MQVSPIATQTADKNTVAESTVSKKTGRSAGQGGTDSADISETGRGMAGFSSSMWSMDGNPDFSMSAYTSRGTSVKLESARTSFSMGKFAKTDGIFQMGGQKKSGLDLNITFTSADGKIQTFQVTENMRFRENENGFITVDNGRTPLKADDKGNVDNSIIVNLNDGGSVQGGDGNDIIFNLGQSAALDGGNGDDTLISMGDGARLLGGEGNDTLKVVRDVIRKEAVDHGTDIKATEANLKKAALSGFEKGQSVYMDGGTGDDFMEADVKLHDSKIIGGDGDDIMKFGTLRSSKLDAGSGNDAIAVDKLIGSSLLGGDGDDSINLGTAADSSLVDGGKGNDSITAGTVQGHSVIRGGDGDDHITVSHLKEASVVDGGDGNDNIYVTRSDHSVIQGGKGDDNIFVAYGESSVIDGGKGNDTITMAKGAYNIITGGEGDDDITVGGYNNIVDGDSGRNSLNTPGASKIADNGVVLTSSISTDKLSTMVSELKEVLNTAHIDGESRQRYQALLSYAAQMGMQHQADGQGEKPIIANG